MAFAIERHDDRASVSLPRQKGEADAVRVGLGRPVREPVAPDGERGAPASHPARRRLLFTVIQEFGAFLGVFGVVFAMIQISLWVTR